MFQQQPILSKRRPHVKGDAIVIGETILAKRTPHGFDYRLDAPPEPVWLEALSKVYGRDIERDASLCAAFAQAIQIFRFDPRRADALLAAFPLAPIRKEDIDLPSTPDFCATPSLCKDGVALGERTIIVGLEQKPSGALALAIEGREEEIYALLCIAGGRLLPPGIVQKFYAASKALESGNASLATIHLAQIGMPPLNDSGLAKTLTHAKRQFEKGASTRTLLKSLVKQDWDESKHPRGEDGRFCPIMGAVSAIGDAVGGAADHVGAFISETTNSLFNGEGAATDQNPLQSAFSEERSTALTPPKQQKPAMRVSSSTPKPLKEQSNSHADKEEGEEKRSNKLVANDEEGLKKFPQAIQNAVKNGDYTQYLGRYVGVNQHCASLTKALTGLPATFYWIMGEQVKDNPNIRVGEGVATFNFNNRYAPSGSGGVSGRSHTGIYLGQDKDGLYLLHQYRRSGGAQVERLPWDYWSGDVHEAGDHYYTIANQRR